MKALILVDIQNDFLPGGALAVPGGDEVIAVANAIQPGFDLVVATQDFHPADHGSFAANHAGRQPYEVIDLNGLPQVLWPVHCVQGTPGAEFAAALSQAAIRKIFPKGTDPRIDSYSGFYDNGRRKSTGMGEWLQSQGVKEVFVCGLATDYCVKATAIDALSFGFKTTLVVDACRGVNLAADDSEKAIEQMRAAGVEIIVSTALQAVS